MPAVKPDSQRSVIGAWARQARRAAEFKSARDAAIALRAQGYPISEEYLRAIELNAKPSDETVAALERLYGSVAPKADPDPTHLLTSPEMLELMRALVVQQSAVVDRLDRLIEAIDLARAPRSRHPRTPEERESVLRQLAPEVAESGLLDRAPGRPPRSEPRTPDAPDREPGNRGT
jgi:predicted RNA-binding Zn ribbon-like protein